MAAPDALKLMKTLRAVADGIQASVDAEQEVVELAQQKFELTQQVVDLTTQVTETLEGIEAAKQDAVADLAKVKQALEASQAELAVVKQEILDAAKVRKQEEQDFVLEVSQKRREFTDEMIARQSELDAVRDQVAEIEAARKEALAKLGA